MPGRFTLLRVAVHAGEPKTLGGAELVPQPEDFVKCFYHVNDDAVALCKNCNRGLCPSCAADMTNGTACLNRCEAQVAAVNEVIERNKTGYQKASGAYSRNALLYLILGVIMCLVGALTLPTGWVMLALGGAMLVGAALSWGTARSMARLGP